MTSKSLSEISRFSRLIALAVMLTPAVWGQSTFKVLHNFSGRNGDGGGVWCSVAFDSAGNIYGTTSGGGAYGYRTVFELSPNGNAPWTETVLHSFMLNDPDGSEPQGNVVFDAAGNIYGTAPDGGAYGAGSVFEMTPGSGSWTFNVVYSFGAIPGDAGAPFDGLTMDPAGNFYGTGGGVVFELTPGLSGWTDTILYTFTGGSDGAGPYAGVIRDRSGRLYGTTEAGGSFLGGTAYEVAQVQGTWQERVLHNFQSSTGDGIRPGDGKFSLDNAGNLYGTTNQGGSNVCAGVSCGTIYELSRNGRGRWKETQLYNFQSGATGYGPGGGVVSDASGNLYGTTVSGGSTSCECGVVYKLAPGSGGTWTYSVLHTFTGTDGAQPDANLVLHNGKLYGTTITGGTGGAGVVFEISP